MKITSTVRHENSRFTSSTTYHFDNGETHTYSYPWREYTGAELDAMPNEAIEKHHYWAVLPDGRFITLESLSPEKTCIASADDAIASLYGVRPRQCVKPAKSWASWRKRWAAKLKKDKMT